MSIAEKLTDIAENVQKVYDAGVSIGNELGQAAGYYEGSQEGMTAEYNRFWGAYQDYGKRPNYENCFSGRGWNDETFKPKYDINTSSGYMLFRRTGITDLGAILNRLGRRIEIDGQDDWSLRYSCAEVLLTNLDGVVINGPIAYLKYTFSTAKNLVSIAPVLEVTKETQFENAFLRCEALEEVRFSGEIGQDGLDLHWSTKLSKASTKNIIGCLSDDTTGKTITFSRDAVDATFDPGYFEEHPLGGAPIWVVGSVGYLGMEWLNLVATKPNWNIILV